MTATAPSPARWRRHLRPALETLHVYDVPPASAPSRMHANECAETWPQEIRTALAAEVAAIELNRYPDTSGRRLRAVLAELHGCDADRIVLGNGSDEIISLLLTALSGDSRAAMVIPDPTFVMYEHTARVLGVEVRKVPLTDALELDGPALRRALVGAALCFIARPNNPTSSLWDAALVRELLDEFPSTVFVVDEAYAAYSPGCSLWRADGPDNYVHMSTLSKVGLAALRVGYAIAPDELALALNKVRHPYNVSQTSLVLAETVLTRFRAAQEQLVARTIEQRVRLIELLRAIPASTVFPAHGNLVLVRLRDRAEADELERGLARGGVLVKNLSDHPRLRGCLRVSVGTADDLDRLEGLLR